MTNKTIFQEQWQTYQDVIQYNYMYHRELISMLSKVLTTMESPKILDLGCGDSYVLSEVLSENPQKLQYTGIDSSEMALAYGKERFSQLNITSQFIHNDLRQGLEGNLQTYDLIIAGYSLHHLNTAEKLKAFTQISAALKPRGKFFFYDLQSRNMESAQDYLNRACHIFSTKWQELNPTQIQSIQKHVQENDIPESAVFYQKAFHSAPFDSNTALFQDPDQLFCAYLAEQKA